jgi:hypothetical protein
MYRHTYVYTGMCTFIHVCILRKFFTVLLLNTVIQSDQKGSVHLMITTHVFLASLLGSTWLLGTRPPGSEGHYSHTNAICYHGKWLKLFKIFLRVFCTVIISCTDTFWSSCIVNYIGVTPSPLLSGKPRAVFYARSCWHNVRLNRVYYWSVCPYISR